MSSSGTPYSSFAPAERASSHELEQQCSIIRLDEIVETLMQAMPDYVMLINRQRQIVAVNPSMLTVTGVSDAIELVGKRPGEALNCINSCTAEGGCGSSEHCSVCGAVLAILESQKTDGQVVRECRVTCSGAVPKVIEFKAIASPIIIRGESFTVFALQDISSEKRREFMERVFFHDILNTAGGIYGLANLLLEHDNLLAHVENDYKKWLVEISGNLVEEIHHQRKLMLAEQGEYTPELSTIALRELLEELFKLYQNHNRTPGRLLHLGDVPDVKLVSDRPILKRIVGNMLINALEATPPGGVVTFGSTSSDCEIAINVHNGGVMPHEVQLQLFTRSFSTKSATGRGIGSYSMKLFGECYLKGRVFFKSNPDEGTVFTITLPLNS